MTPHRPVMPADLRTDQPARQTQRGQPLDLLLLTLRQPFHTTPPTESNSIERRDALIP
jgi:hypothetical protein